MSEFSGYRGIVTGATAGLGLAIAQHLARGGASLAICGRNSERLEDALEFLTPLTDGDVWGTPADMSDAQSIADFAHQAVSQLGSLDFIVANAGGDWGRSSLEASGDEWVKTYMLNTVQVVLLLESTLPWLKQSHHAAVVAITSISGRLSAPRAQYGAAKAATRYAVESLAKELGPESIRINAVAPGSILMDDGHWEAWRQKNPDSYATFCARELPRGRFITANEVAQTVGFLLSPGASGITGTEVAVDGGQLSPTPVTWPWRRMERDR